MIVELCGADLLELVNGRQIAVLDVIVRPTEAEMSTVKGDRSTVSAPVGSSNRAKSRVPKSGQRWMRAIYPHGRCAEACTNTWQKGDLMLYDYDTRRSLCPTHGKAAFPNLPIPEELR